MFLSVIGTSKIIEKHLESAKKNKFILHSIATTRGKNTNNLEKIFKDYLFINKFSNWKDLYDSTKNIDNMVYLISPRIKETFKIANYFLKNKKKIIVEKPLSTQIKNFETLKNLKQNIFVGYNRVYYNNVQYLKK
ncbi:Gfo/Idh/MocA family oxidoreductase, partial [Candidatus Pelagibacter sp.]|nr:Gfo/Idh/MocA family oxidoreductase [Candidatus Pelagibacter sp.]